MKIKKGLQISSSEFWYDLTWGGYLDPDKICESAEDAQKVQDAINVLREFEMSCNEQIEGFEQ